MEIICILLISFLALGYAIVKLCSISGRRKLEKELKKEKLLYEVKPFEMIADFWENIEDFPSEYKSKRLFFSDLEGKKLFAVFVKENGKEFWKLYIVGEKSEIQRVFVRLNALNIVSHVEGNM